MFGLPLLRVFNSLTVDGWLLFGTRCIRMFAYGLLSVVLVLYLTQLGLSEPQIGLLLTLTLLGDTAISLWITTTADRLGRRRMLVIGALLMVLAAVVFAVTSQFVFLLAAAIIGVISPSGNEVGPFLSIEQAALSQEIVDENRTAIFAWYNLAGSIATALGALVGGIACELLLEAGLRGAAVYRPLIIAYGIIGLLLALGFLVLSPATEATASMLGKPRWFGLHHSGRIVARLSALFAMDAFGGGFVIQSFLAYWFVVRYHVDPLVLGSIFFAANLLAALSALAAAALARRFGLLNTMVFTHLPSNVLLILVPLMPTVELAIAVLLLRYSISQMDVPTRQSYTMAVVRPEERSAAAGITGVARSIGAAVPPMLVGVMFADAGWLDVPFFLAGGIKIVYDLLLYRAFRASKSV